MIKKAFARLSPLLLALPLLTLVGCPNNVPPAPEPLPVHDDEKKVAALETQLKAAEAAGWNDQQERQFSATAATLSLGTRLAYAQRLAKAISRGKVKVQPTPPPPPNVPACPCGGSACTAAANTPPPTPVPSRKGSAQRSTAP